MLPDYQPLVSINDVTICTHTLFSFSSLLPAIHEIGILGEGIGHIWTAPCIMKCEIFISALPGLAQSKANSHTQKMCLWPKPFILLGVADFDSANFSVFALPGTIGIP